MYYYHSGLGVHADIRRRLIGVLYSFEVPIIYRYHARSVTDTRAIIKLQPALRMNLMNKFYWHS